MLCIVQNNLSTLPSSSQRSAGMHYSSLPGLACGAVGNLPQLIYFRKNPRPEHEVGVVWREGENVEVEKWRETKSSCEPHGRQKRREYTNKIYFMKNKRFVGGYAMYCTEQSIYFAI